MTTAAVALTDLDQTFYVPEHVVRLDGVELDDGVVRDILEVKYTDDVEEIDSFELRIANWDTETFTPKYEPPSKPEHEGLFDPGREIQLEMGYAGDTQLMVRGQITTLEPSFPESGPSVLSVRGLNTLHQLRSEQHSMSWTDQRDSDIARDLGSRPRKKGRAGLGMEVEIDPLPEEPREPYVFMDNQYDIVFLLQRARRHGYEVVLQEPDDEHDEPYLYFGPSRSQGQRPAPYLLEWGRTLSSFTPTLSTAQQVAEVIVRGWDRRRNQLIEGKASWESCVKGEAEKQRLQQLAQAFGGRREVVTDEPVHTKGQAEARAKEILEDQLKIMVEASGSTVGLPGLRAGRRVSIVGLGPRYDGEYFLTHTSHSLGDSGYRTEFKARREGQPRTAPAGGGS